MHWGRGGGDGCLVPRSYYSAWPKRFGSRGPSESPRELTERDWESAVQLYPARGRLALHLKSKSPPARAGSFSQINYLHTLFLGAVRI